MTDLASRHRSSASPSLDQLIPTITAGFAVGIFSVIYCVSFAALIFSGSLSSYIAPGIGLLLVSAIATGLCATLLSSYPAIIATPQSSTVAIMALVASTIADKLSIMDDPTLIYATVIATITINSLMTGLIFFALGRFRLGELVRFIPYPVVGGFLAGSGWLLVNGSIRLMSQLALNWQNLPSLFERPLLELWLPGVLFGLTLRPVMGRFRHFLTFPVMIAGAIALFYIALWLTHTPLNQASEQGLLLGPFPNGNLWQLPPVEKIGAIDWRLIFTEVPNLATIWIVNTLILLLNISGLELSTQRDIDLNYELKTAGTGCFLVGLTGSMGGFVSLSLSTLAHKLGTKGRLVGYCAVTLCGIILFVGASFLAFLPKLVVGGLLFYLGTGFLWEWLYQGRQKLSRPDYIIVVLIVLTVAAFGYLPGVGVGIIAAIILFVVDYSQINVSKNIFSGRNYQSNVQRSPAEEHVLMQHGEEIHILELQGLIFFGTANKLLNTIRERLKDPQAANLRFIVLSFRLVNGLDSSAVISFVKLKQIAQKFGIFILLTHLSDTIKQKFYENDLLIDGDHEVCLAFPDLDRAVEWCEEQLLAQAELDNWAELPFEKQLQSLFGDRPEALRLLDYLTKVPLAAAETLFQQGDYSDGLYFLDKGHVSVVLKLVNGKRKRLCTYSSGTILGEMGLYNQVPRSAAVIAEEDSELYFLSREAFEIIEAKDAQLAALFHKFIVNLLTERLKRRETELRNLLQ